MRDTALFRLDGKTSVIVGAGSGIGAAVAAGCAQQGSHVYCFDINLDAAEAVAVKIRDEGGDADAAMLDVRDAEAINAAFSSICDRHGRLDNVISTPAVHVRKPLLSLKAD